MLYPIKELSPGLTTRVGLVPVAAKFLLENANGEEVVEINSATLGLKSKVSDALNPDAKIGISFSNLSSE